MSKHPRRCYGGGYLHFITTSSKQRRAWLGRPSCRDLFLRILEQTPQRYGFVVVGYVIMPEHVHLLISEPEKETPSTVMQVLKLVVTQEAKKTRPETVDRLERLVRPKCEIVEWPPALGK